MDGNTTTTVVEEVKDPTAVLAELRRAQEDLKAVRAENRELKKQAENNDPTEWKERAIKAETKLALSATGLKDTDRLLNYVTTDGIEFDEDGNLTGLDEKLTQLKTDLPELFDPKRRVGGKADIFADDPAEPKTDPLRQQVRAALGG